MTISELLQYATSLGIGIGCENENPDVVTAILDGIITDELQIADFCGF